MALLDNTYALIAPTTRFIATLIPDCTFEEHHFDRVIVTEHPVETGAAITDHAFRAPSELTMKVGFSNSTARTEGWVQQAYQLLLALQQARQPFAVSTGKRAYQNMLIETLETVTDEGSEWSLPISVGMKEVILVSSQQVGSSNGIATSQADQAMPQNTVPTSPAGPVQLQTPSAPSNVGDFSSVQMAIG